MLGQRYCHPCKLTHLRAWRAARPRTDIDRLKERAQAAARAAKADGILVAKPCACGSTKVEMHHPDYSKPLDVVWLCRLCHRAEHRPMSALAFSRWCADQAARLAVKGSSA